MGNALCKADSKCCVDDEDVDDEVVVALVMDMGSDDTIKDKNPRRIRLELEILAVVEDTTMKETLRTRA